MDCFSFMRKPRMRISLQRTRTQKQDRKAKYQQQMQFSGQPLAHSSSLVQSFFEESSWLYCLQLERLNLTVHGLFHFQLVFNLCDKNCFPEELLRLDTSNYAVRVQIYYCKHLHTYTPSAIAAFHHNIDTKWDDLSLHNFNAPWATTTVANVAVRLGSILLVGSGLYFFRNVWMQAVNTGSVDH